MVVSPRVKNTAALLVALRTNPRLRTNELVNLEKPAASPGSSQPAAQDTANVAPVAGLDANGETAVAESPNALESEPTSPATAEPESADDEVFAKAIAHYLEENAAELAAEGDKPFQPVRLSHEGTEASATNLNDAPVAEAEAQAAEATESQAKPAAAFRPAAPGVKHAKKPGPPVEGERRDSTLQKIAKLDIKGRIALAMRGSKEERSILIRDGTKLVAIAVLDSPKISDGEVENFALQKNVLEAVLRAIPLKRRFVKNYAIMRNLVYNPRTPLDQSLGLMKNLLVHDLKNLSENKEVSDTIRKLALRMYKQKHEKKRE